MYTQAYKHMCSHAPTHIIADKHMGAEAIGRDVTEELLGTSLPEQGWGTLSRTDAQAAFRGVSGTVQREEEAKEFGNFLLRAAEGERELKS